MSERDPGHGWQGRPARSGADTPRSTEIIQHGGKVDQNALLKRILETQAASAPTPSADGDDQAGPIVSSVEGDLLPPAADDDAPNRVVFVLQRDLDKRLDKYLTDRITFMSRTQLQGLINEGGVTVNGGRCKASTKLRSGDRVEVYVPPPPPTEIQPENIPIDVLYEDEHVIVLNKSPDIIVHPARAHNKGTLLNALAYHFQNRSAGALSGVGKEFARPGVVHRLDRQTSGLIVFAKSDEAHWRIGQQFERRTVDKRYLAIVQGLFEPPIDVIDLPLGPHPSREKGYREKYVVRHDALGKQSLTIARVRQHFRVPEDRVAQETPAAPRPHLGWESAAELSSPHPDRGPKPHGVVGYSLVELELKSGRTHQIRVHLTHRGFSIVGDDMYGGKPLFRASGRSPLTSQESDAAHDDRDRPLVLMGRVALHAATLAFKHPADGRPMAFTAPFPADMGGALAALRDMDKLSTTLAPPGATVRIPG
jgi:23S rRNA pseudouridine1911/1915/1917 synthase